MANEILSDEELDAVAAGGIFDFIGNQVNAVGNAVKTVGGFVKNQMIKPLTDGIYNGAKKGMDIILDKGGFYNFINNLTINDEAKRLNLIQPNDETNRL